jgi:dCTP deaminase
MILSDKDIKVLLGDGSMKIEPLEDVQIGPASVDLTLSDEWHLFKEELMGKTVDLKETRFQDAFDITKGDSIVLQPLQLCLAKTVEKITLPADIMGNLEGRSRYARMGLVIHITSALVQPGSSNHQVLEIVNLAPFPVKLYAGMRISQVVFERLESGTTKPYSEFGRIARDQ